MTIEQAARAKELGITHPDDRFLEEARDILERFQATGVVLVVVGGLRGRMGYAALGHPGLILALPEGMLSIACDLERAVGHILSDKTVAPSEPGAKLEM